MRSLRGRAGPTTVSRVRGAPATLLALLALAAWPALAGPAATDAALAAGAGPPGVLVLALDTVRADHLRCCGKTDIETPHIDALARDGVLFRDCLSTAPWTLPAFASVLTGLVPYRHGAVGGAYQVLPAEVETLPEILSRRGYATAACVTIGWLTAEFGLDQGYEAVTHLEPHGGDYRATDVTACGRDFLSAHARRPFFLFLHWYDAHAPYLPPAPFDRMYYDGDERAPGTPLHDLLLSGRNLALNRDDGMYDWLQGVTDLAYPVRQYAAGVSYVDDQVGRVLAHLRAEGLYDDLLIVLVADHGEHLTEHDLYFTHRFPYQEALRVPLVVKLPGGRFAGRVVQEWVSIVDILPTILEVLELPVPGDLDGRSLLPLLVDGPPADGAAPRALLAEQGGRPRRFSKALLEWPWKLLFFRTGNREIYQLFDLSADPGELVDLASERPRVRDRLRERLWTLCDHERPLVADPTVREAEIDPATRRRLRALGY